LEDVQAGVAGGSIALSPIVDDRVLQDLWPADCSSQVARQGGNGAAETHPAASDPDKAPFVTIEKEIVFLLLESYPLKVVHMLLRHIPRPRTPIKLLLLQ
jgi:hypothetical protein